MKKDFRLTTSHLSEGAIKALHEIPITTWYGLVNALDNKADAETLIKFRNLYEGTLLVIKDFVKKHNAKKCDVSCKDYDNCKAIIVNNIEYFAEFAHEIKRITNPELPSGERLKSAGKAARKYEDFQDSIKNTPDCIEPEAFNNVIKSNADEERIFVLDFISFLRTIKNCK